MEFIHFESIFIESSFQEQTFYVMFFNKQLKKNVLYKSLYVSESPSWMFKQLKRKHTFFVKPQKNCLQRFRSI